jgi:uncharacterized membrane protein
MSGSKSTFTSLRNSFLTGLALLAPLAITYIVFAWLVDAVGGTFRPLFFFGLPEALRDHPSLLIAWNVLSTLLVLILVTALGYVSRYVLGRFFGQIAERFVLSIPGVSTVYTTVKQVVATFSAQNRNVFSKVVMIEFPRPGMWAIGFLTNRDIGEPAQRAGRELWTVFVPTTPNPTSGFLVMAAREDVTELEMSVGDGMKMVISGGAVTPASVGIAHPASPTASVTGTPPSTAQS